MPSSNPNKSNTTPPKSALRSSIRTPTKSNAITPERTPPQMSPRVQFDEQPNDARVSSPPQRATRSTSTIQF